ncbi:hypothetical protein vseg_002335 [Gypsophila vaccaria]
MERGPRYEVYAHLRESNLKSKRFKLDEDYRVSEKPKLIDSSLVKKCDEFDGSLGDLGEEIRILEIPKPGFLSKSVKFHGMLNGCEENVSVCEIPKSDHSPILKKSSKFHRDLYDVDENERVFEVSRANVGKKSVKFHGENVEISPKLKKTERKQRCSVLAQSVPDLGSVLRKENRKPRPENGNVSRIPTFGTPALSMSKRKSVNSGEKQRNVGMMMSRKSYASVEELKGLSIVASNGINGENKRGRKSAIFSSKYY